MSIELKIKAKHLSEEARIIRFEENKILKHTRNVRHRQGHITADKVLQTYYSLSNHRKWDVRNENRATFLARAYIAGIPYKVVEQSRKLENEYRFQVFIIPRIASMVAAYGKPRISKKIYDFSAKKDVENPSFAELQKQIKEWAKL